MSTSSTTNQTEIDSWISRLAEQSWQAELIISGIAIYGSLSLPGQIQELTDWCLITFSDAYLSILLFLMLYLFVASQFLIGGFLIHFILRVLWIGMLGISSVFPEGVKPMSMYSDHYNAQMREEFGDGSAYSKKLDQASSVIFAMVSSIALMVVSGGLLMIASLCISSLVNSVIPGLPIGSIFSFLILLAFIPTLLASFLHMKSLREKDWVKRYHFPFYKFSATVIFNIFFQPIHYVILTLMSHSNKRQAVLGYIFFLVTVGAGAYYAIGHSNLIFYEETALAKHSNRTDRIFENYYADMREEYELILFSSIPSYSVKGSILQVFVPIFEREQGRIDELYYEMPDPGPDRAARRAKSLNNLQNYISFVLNDKSVDPIAFHRKTHEPTGQDGILASIALDSIQPYSNTLKIEKNYLPDGETAWIVQIPFVKE